MIGALASLLMGLCTPIYGIIFGSILGIFHEEKSKILILNNYYCVIFLVMAVVSFLAAFLQVFMFSVASENITAKLRKKVFTKIITQDIEFFDKFENNVGSLCSKLSSDASDMQGATGSRISTVLQALATLLASFFLALNYNFKIGLLVLAFIPLVTFAVYLEGKFSSGQIIDEKICLEKASKIAAEAVENIKTVVSLHQEYAFYTQFEKALIKLLKNTKKRAALRGLTFAFAQSVQVLAYSASFYYGSLLIFNGELDYSDLYKVLEGIIIGAFILGQAVAFSPDYTKAKAAAARIFKILDLKSEINVLSCNRGISKSMTGRVSFKSVQFSYPSRPNVNVLKGVDFEIEQGQTIALVGQSGCGKSTCIQLIERFYDTKEGDILFDDVGIKQLNPGYLRSQIGLVSQEPVLFGYSIAENIAYGDNSRKVNLDEVITAATKANIHDFIASLPEGYETNIGSKGMQLSGGQKQRIAIARALVRNPKILLLDEATSALDSESEQIVQEALDKARTGRSCLIIAHRLSTVKNADIIAVIHKGKIIEKGTHQDLLKMKGSYFKLYNSH